ncbi:rod shape-determining protein MreC [Candidatus Pelagibacter sp.]|nr:rod shape-determining protein MreC [Candidatus Pelagibacter sp.]
MINNRDDFIIAIRSAFLKKGTQQRFSLLSLILFSIIFLILGHFNFKIINFNKIVIKEIVYASSFITSIPENTFKRSYKKISDHLSYYKDYKKIESQLQQLQTKDLSKKIITFENIQLKKLIDDYLIENNEIYAKILIDKESPFLRSVVINKGSKNNIKLGMIALDGIYLVGKVVEVNFFSARILLISDINSKIPVSLQPGDIQGIMSGKNKSQGTLQYIKLENLKNKGETFKVVTSGAGGVFKSGIPIGEIKGVADDDSSGLRIKASKNINFYQDFSQLKYVKIVSYSKEGINLDELNKKEFKENNNQILTINDQAEDIKVLLQQKIINDEIKIKYEKENTILKEKLIQTQKNLDLIKKDNRKKLILEEEIEFLRLNLLHGHKCKKTFLKQKLFKIGTPEYKDCVLSKKIN